MNHPRYADKDEAQGMAEWFEEWYVERMGNRQSAEFWQGFRAFALDALWADGGLTQPPYKPGIQYDAWKYGEAEAINHINAFYAPDNPETDVSHY